jgi:hypothetical protein
MIRLAGRRISIGVSSDPKVSCSDYSLSIMTPGIGKNKSSLMRPDEKSVQ